MQGRLVHVGLWSCAPLVLRMAASSFQRAQQSHMQEIYSSAILSVTPSNLIHRAVLFDKNKGLLTVNDKEYSVDR